MKLNTVFDEYPKEQKDKFEKFYKEAEKRKIDLLENFFSTKNHNEYCDRIIFLHRKIRESISSDGAQIYKNYLKNVEKSGIKYINTFACEFYSEYKKELYEANLKEYRKEHIRFWNESFLWNKFKKEKY